MTQIPYRIGGANVLYNVQISDSIGFTKNTEYIVSGILQPAMSGLAICQYENDKGFYLFGCDKNWESITDTFHLTIDEANTQAEFEYKGTQERWIKR